MQLKHANTILLLQMLHQYDWLSCRKCICDWLLRRKCTCWWIIVCLNLQHKLCATLSANVNINCCLPIKVYTTVFVLLDISEIIHGSQNVFWVLTHVKTQNTFWLPWFIKSPKQSLGDLLFLLRFLLLFFSFFSFLSADHELGGKNSTFSDIIKIWYMGR